MRYQEALEYAQSGKQQVIALAGGRKRYGKFAVTVPGSVAVILFKTRIAEFREDDTVTLWTGGYNTATTREAMNTLLRPRYRVGNDKQILYVWDRFSARRPFHEGIKLSMSS